jgi:hypothetical protein
VTSDMLLREGVPTAVFNGDPRLFADALEAHFD